MTKVELNKSTCILLEKGVINVIYKNNVEIELEDVIEIRKVTLQMSEGNPYVAIYESGEQTIVTKEAREIPMIDDTIKNRKALAIIMNNLPQRIIINFFIRTNKKSHPIKAFTSKTEALKWAKQFLKN
jgi:hypothetical protein